MNTTVKVKKAEVRDILSATFPEYTGRKIKIEFADCVTIWDSNWGGGTRNWYKLLNVNMTTMTVPAPSPWQNLDGKTIELTPDFIIVEHSVFCGKDCGITIHAHTSHLPKWLA